MNTGTAQKRVDELDEEIRLLEEQAARSTGLVTNPNTPPAEPTQPTTEQVVAPTEGKEEGTWSQRYANLRRHAQKKEDELKAKIAELESRTTNAAPPTDPEKVREWVNKYPEVAAIVKSLSREANEDASTSITNKIKEIETLNSQLLRDKAEAKVRKAHPDFDELREDTNPFHDWVEKQPDLVQSIVYGEELNPDGLIWAISLYKDLSNKKNPDTDAAKAVSTKGNRGTPSTDGGERRFSESQVDAMSSQEYDKYEEEIHAAIRAGTFVYDMTGAAR